ncbi:unnamed protein product [Arabidopsis halleri]
MARRRRTFSSRFCSGFSFSAFSVRFQIQTTWFDTKLPQIWRGRLAEVVFDASLLSPVENLFPVPHRRSFLQPCLFSPFNWFPLILHPCCVQSSAAAFSVEDFSVFGGDATPPPSLFKAPARSCLLSAARFCDGEIPCGVGDQLWALQRMGRWLTSWLLGLWMEKPISNHPSPSRLRSFRCPFCPPLATLCFSNCRFTGYFSGLFHGHTRYFSGSPSSLDPPLLDRFPPICGEDTGYFSGPPLPASEAIAGCFQTRITYAGSSFVLTSQEMVTTSFPVDVYVLFAICFMGVLVIVSFDTSPGLLSSFFKLVSLCLIIVCSCTLIFKLAIWSCPNTLTRLVTF